MIAMILYCVLGALLLVAAALALSRDVWFVLTADDSAVRMKLKLRLLNVITILHFDLLLFWKEGAAYINGRRLNKRRQKQEPRPNPVNTPRLLLRLGSIRQLTVKGGVGVREDAGLSVLLTGTMNEAARIILSLLGAQSFALMLFPAFDRDEFCINLEGIARLYPVQIMCAALNMSRETKGSGNRTKRRG